MAKSAPPWYIAAQEEKGIGPAGPQGPDKIPLRAIVDGSVDFTTFVSVDELLGKGGAAQEFEMSDSEREHFERRKTLLSDHV